MHIIDNSATRMHRDVVIDKTGSVAVQLMVIVQPDETESTNAVARESSLRFTNLFSDSSEQSDGQ